MKSSRQVMEEQGWCLLEPALEPGLVETLTRELDAAYETCRSIQIRNGLSQNTEGTAHHLVCFGGAFLALLERYANHQFIEAFFGGKYILNTYGAVLNEPGSNAYV